MRRVDPHEVVIGRAEGSGELVVYGRLQVPPHRYFRSSGGTWHVRDRAGRTTSSR
jgi:hypothetical protein